MLRAPTPSRAHSSIRRASIQPKRCAATERDPGRKPGLSRILRATQLIGLLMLVLIGIPIVIVGFMLKRNPLLVVIIASVATGLVAGLDVAKVIAAFGK